MTTTKQNYTVPIIMMILLFGMIAFVTNLAAPMGVVLKDQFGVSNFQGLLGNAANFIAYAVMGIPGGILLQRIGYKKTALLAIAVGFVGVGIQYLSGYASETTAFTVYLLGAFVAGFSMTLLNTVVNPMLNTLGGGGNKGNQLIQVGGSFNSVMATFTPAFVGILIGEAASAKITDVFPVMYIAMGIFATIFVVMSMVKIPEPGIEHASEPMRNLMSGVLKYSHFVMGAVAIFVYVGVEVGVAGVLNLWLSDIPEVGKTIAGSVAGTYWALMLVGRLTGAALGSKISSKAMLTFASLLGLVLVLAAILLPTTMQVGLPVLQRSAVGALSFGLANVPINAMLLVLVGLSTSIMWGSIFNLAVEGLGKYLAAASGIFMTMVVGGGLLPLVQGMVADMTSYLTSYWVIVIALGYLLFYAVIGSNVKKRADGVTI
ncbi:MAG: MFS transporter [Prolixibacteraceae bacterium]|jgi:MFS transporter, FHS family, L-fucose permease|nr:MFS transporter [Prolixibacteraceae bacterium]MBT6007044.1 MFS transporter [Prolixibacteraceae bacterium]MBT6762994.1 MFS transporter [Prolixibacteraceae bacterium]MBT6997481.1 MFS transporter [Prolixibacteraceae bacterium]MBT7396181.1 MFS transporter [Prolixibacteraceae bacterium]